MQKFVTEAPAEDLAGCAFWGCHRLVLTNKGRALSSFGLPSSHMWRLLPAAVGGPSFHQSSPLL